MSIIRFLIWLMLFAVNMLQKKFETGQARLAAESSPRPLVGSIKLTLRFAEATEMIEA